MFYLTLFFLYNVGQLFQCFIKLDQICLCILSFGLSNENFLFVK